MISQAIIDEIRGEIGERRGAERRAIVRRWADRLGVSEQLIYRATRSDTDGHRRTRIDKGVMQVGVSEEQLKVVAAIMMESWDDKGRIKMPAWKAIKMAEDGGALPVGVLKECTFNRWLRGRDLSKSSALEPSNHVSIRTETVNELHEYDTSQCAQWYLDPASSAATPLHVGWQRWDYKNKPLKGLPIKRHLIVDHFSGCFFVMYLPSEDCAASLEFLFSAWQRKTPGAFFAALGVAAQPDQIERAGKIAEAFPFHGTPRNLLTDNGSLVKSASGRQALERLRIEYRTHTVGNPRAKGAVESMMWKWETTFESELRRRPAKDLVEFNLRAFEFAAWFQAERVHTRTRKTRFGCFMDEMDGMDKMDLRELPEDRALLRSLAMMADEKRQIRHHGAISFDGREYYVADQALWGKECVCGVDIFHPPDLFVRCEGKEFIVAASEILKGGFSEHSVRLGEFKSPRDSDAQSAIKEIAKIDLNTRTGTDGHGLAQTELKALGAPRGVEIDLNSPVVERVYSKLQAKHEAARRQGYPLLNWQIEAIEREFGEGKEVKESRLNEILKGLCGKALSAQSAG